MVSGKTKQELTKTQKKDKIQSSKGKKPKQQHLYSIQTTTMTKKKKALIEAICDRYGFDYPEAGDNGDENDERTEDEIYEDKLNEYDFKS